MKLNKGNKTAIIFGATGLVGSHCLQALLNSEAYCIVKVFTRKPLQFKHKKLVVHQIDFNNLVPLAYPNMECDDIFICLGTTIKKAGSQENFYRVDYKYVILAAEMAHRRGASQLMLVSSVGANSDSKVFYKRVKGEVEEQVLRMPFWAIHIFRPSLLLGKRKEFRAGEAVAKFVGKRADKIVGDFLEKFRPIDAHRVGKFMVDAAQQLKPGSHLYPSHLMLKPFNYE